ncbi:glycine-rich cell wall structural protein 1.8-like [Asparagus officinalis]|uniref:glycine-rich cell wall structural protein 1.8-like n=1 Tax=Asparagus officinalis TaxID=4686 RepID=UPI00098E38FB|nr:glycine-rich cell wall structural protein 1.8-like [Asparagus officinalis]
MAVVITEGLNGGYWHTVEHMACDGGDGRQRAAGLDSDASGGWRGRRGGWTEAGKVTKVVRFVVGCSGVRARAAREREGAADEASGGGEVTAARARRSWQRRAVGARTRRRTWGREGERNKGTGAGGSERRSPGGVPPGAEVGDGGWGDGPGTGRGYRDRAAVVRFGAGKRQGRKAKTRTDVGTEGKNKKEVFLGQQATGLGAGFIKGERPSRVESTCRAAQVP